MSASPTATKHADLPRPQVELLFDGPDAIGRHIEVAVRPYRLQITPEAAGAQIAGDEIAVVLAEKILAQISAALAAKGPADEALVKDAAATVIHGTLRHDLAYRLAGLRQALLPVSLSQVAFMNAVLYGNRSLIFGIGPTGTGKTHLAIAAGLNHVAQSRFKRMIMTRPHVRMQGEVMTAEMAAETGADEQLTPIEDVLRDLIGREEIRRLSDQGMIEIMPLGRMRGRTFNDSYIVVDDAHNMTVRKMRMAVTRLGRNSRMVITGDAEQNDLPSGETSGLTHLLGLIADTDYALIHRFQNDEIVRNALVARLEALYSQDDNPELRAAA